jgi:hypothetical protein
LVNQYCQVIDRKVQNIQKVATTAKPHNEYTRAKSTSKIREYDYPLKKESKRRLKSTEPYRNEEVKNTDDNNRSKLSMSRESLNNSHLNNLNNVSNIFEKNQREFTFESGKFKTSITNRFRYGVIICDYEPSEENELPCQQGDRVKVLSKEDNFYLISDGNRMGLVPEEIVHFEE